MNNKFVVGCSRKQGCCSKSKNTYTFPSGWKILASQNLFCHWRFSLRRSIWHRKRFSTSWLPQHMLSLIHEAFTFYVTYIYRAIMLHLLLHTIHRKAIYAASNPDCNGLGNELKHWEGNFKPLSINYLLLCTWDGTSVQQLIIQSARWRACVETIGFYESARCIVKRKPIRCNNMLNIKYLVKHIFSSRILYFMHFVSLKLTRS